MSTLFKSNNETTPEKEEEDDHLKSEVKADLLRKMINTR